MLECTKSADEHVALEACEFWLAMAEEEAARDMLIPVMDQLLPVLLELLKYSEMELFLLKVSEKEGEGDAFKAAPGWLRGDYVRAGCGVMTSFFVS